MTINAEVVLPLLNIANTLTNLFWSMKLKSIQGNKEILSSLKEANDEKDQVIKELQRKKNQYKMQYTQQLVLNEKLQGELKTYKKFHNHE